MDSLKVAGIFWFTGTLVAPLMGFVEPTAGIAPVAPWFEFPDAPPHPAMKPAIKNASIQIVGAVALRISISSSIAENSLAGVALWPHRRPTVAAGTKRLDRSRESSRLSPGWRASYRAQ
jgi:hypothetical protein